MVVHGRPAADRLHAARRAHRVRVLRHHRGLRNVLRADADARCPPSASPPRRSDCSPRTCCSSTTTRDIDHDVTTGRRTLAVVLDRRNAMRLHALLVLVPFALAAILAWRRESRWFALPLLALPAAWRLSRDVAATMTGAAMNALLFRTVALELELRAHCCRSARSRTACADRNRARSAQRRRPTSVPCAIARFASSSAATSAPPISVVGMPRCAAAASRSRRGSWPAQMTIVSTAQRLRHAVDADVQAGVVDALVFDAGERSHAALLEQRAADPAGGLGEALADLARLALQQPHLARRDGYRRAASGRRVRDSRRRCPIRRDIRRSRRRPP